VCEREKEEKREMEGGKAVMCVCASSKYLFEIDVRQHYNFSQCVCFGAPHSSFRGHFNRPDLRLHICLQILLFVRESIPKDHLEIYMHENTRTCTHAHVHHKYMNMVIPMPMLMLMLTHTHTHVHAHAHAYTHIH